MPSGGDQAHRKGRGSRQAARAIFDSWWDEEKAHVLLDKMYALATNGLDRQAGTWLLDQGFGKAAVLEEVTVTHEITFEEAQGLRRQVAQARLESGDPPAGEVNLESPARAQVIDGELA